MMRTPGYLVDRIVVLAAQVRVVHPCRMGPGWCRSGPRRTRSPSWDNSLFRSVSSPAGGCPARCASSVPRVPGPGRPAVDPRPSGATAPAARARPPSPPGPHPSPSGGCRFGRPAVAPARRVAPAPPPHPVPALPRAAPARCGDRCAGEPVRADTGGRSPQGRGARVYSPKLAVLINFPQEPHVRPVHFAAARRTPIGKLRGCPVHRAPGRPRRRRHPRPARRVPALDPARIDDVYWGAANQAGEDNRNVARMAALLAGPARRPYPARPSTACAPPASKPSPPPPAPSPPARPTRPRGRLRVDEPRPLRAPAPRRGAPAQDGDVRHPPGLATGQPAMQELHGVLAMGETAEEVADRYDVSPRAPGRLRAAQPPATPPTPARTASSTPRSCRHPPRRRRRRAATSASARTPPWRSSPRLKPVFRDGGTVTAGNASPMNDGAAGLLLVSEDALHDLGLESLGRYVAGASAGVAPRRHGHRPRPRHAARRSPASAGPSSDLQEAEFNEAFAAQALACVDALGIDPELVNPTAAPSRSATRSAAPAPASSPPCCTACAAPAAAAASPPCASASARAPPSSSTATEPPATAAPPRAARPGPRACSSRHDLVFLTPAPGFTTTGSASPWSRFRRAYRLRASRDPSGVRR